MITPDEVKQYLVDHGAENVIVLKLPEPLDNIRHFVIASATSTRLIRQFGETIVERVRINTSFNVYYFISN